MALEETHDERNARLKTEYEAKPAAERAELERGFNLQFGDKPVKPEDVKPSRNLAEYEAELDRSIAGAQAEHARQPAGAPLDVAKIEPSPVDIEVEQSLQAEWGDQYAEKTAAAGEALRSLFPTVEAMVEAGRALGIDRDAAKQLKVLNLLADMGRGRQ